MTVAVDTRELDPYLKELTARGWTHFYFPNREKPVAIASAFWHTDCVDVVQIFDRADAFAYRAVLTRRDTLFAPDLVLWTYGGDAVWTVRQTMTLPTPGEPDAPTQPLPPPPMVRVLQRISLTTKAMVVRPPRSRS